MNDIHPPSKASSGVVVGATLVAFIIVLVVLAVVASIVGGLMALVNYYMSSMRIEAAGFFGAMIGGWVGVVSSRASCDAILKYYSKRSVFIFILMIALLGLGFEFLMMPLEWARLTPVSQLVVIAVAAYTYFWNDADID